MAVVGAPYTLRALRLAHEVFEVGSSKRVDGKKHGGALGLFPGGYEGGRYLLPSVGAFAFLFWQGLSFLVPKRWQPVIVVGVLVLLLVLNVGCIVNLTNFLNPLYAPP